MFLSNEVLGKIAWCWDRWRDLLLGISFWWVLIRCLKVEFSFVIVGELVFEKRFVEDVIGDIKGFDNWEEVQLFCDEFSSHRDSSELKEEESVFAYLISFGMSQWVESEKRMKLGRWGCKRDSIGW